MTAISGVPSASSQIGTEFLSDLHDTIDVEPNPLIGPEPLDSNSFSGVVESLIRDKYMDRGMVEGLMRDEHIKLNPVLPDSISPDLEVLAEQIATELSSSDSSSGYALLADRDANLREEQQGLVPTDKGTLINNNILPVIAGSTATS